jgi:hypothetical protein
MSDRSAITFDRLYRVFCESHAADIVSDNPTGCYTDCPECYIHTLQASSIAELWTKHSEWSDATFGIVAERGPIGPLKHLELEAREAQAAPHDIEEYADIFLLALDSARRAGFSASALIQWAFAKVAKNALREWPKGAPDEAVEHVRS